MKLSLLISDLPAKEKCFFQDQEITHIAFHSQRVEKGSLFVAITGFKKDGHDFVQEALDRGAKAIVTEKKVPVKAPQIVVTDTRFALSFLCDRFFHSPSKDLYCIAVTGTNGKTTTTSITAQLLEKSSIPTCYFSTVLNKIGDETFSLPLTTNDPWSLHHLLAQARAKKMKVAVIEVSSHAIALKRVAHISWQRAGLTNITQDHLDFHKTMEEYARTKISLFALLKKKGAGAAANEDDPWQRKYRRAFPEATIWYGTSPKALLRAENIEVSSDGFCAKIESPLGTLKVTSPLRGRFQVHNLLCALALILPFPVKKKNLEKAVAQLQPVPGRMEPVEQGQPFSVLVDYAHTPDALAKVLSAVQEWTQGKVILVFGCGGDRDKTKRAKMGLVAHKHADLTVVTSDNPRSEDPEKIMAQILKGFPDKERVKVEKDRKKAIGLALALAQRNDTLVIAGKGHETYQILKDKTIHFDDRKVAQEWLASKIQKR